MAQDNNPVRVLVIDGSRNVRDFIVEQVLIPHGYLPLAARDGAEGLRKALTEIPDLILMDYELPLVSGRDVLEALRARPLQVPVVLMTSRGTEEITLPLIRLGVRDYLVRPFTADEMLQSIQRSLYEVQLRREKLALSQRLARTDGKLRSCLVELNIFYQVGQAVTGQLPLESLLERITDAALYLSQAEMCRLLVHDPETGRTVERVCRQRERAVVRPMLAEPTPGLDRLGKVAAMLHVPLRVGSRELGVLSVENQRTPRNFNDHQRQMLRVLADYAAIAIENARLLRQAKNAASPD